ncbi:hypothetical protein [Neobacillus niacini]|uniref:hypothetical protein n=1 Tax=Neobacillus niacini TaxID=86668 RepID=UPI002857CFB9|nr:hypothetical protein [Neobacillus niacini]MDR7001548.1 hypothetical protein [Neobacillus niacini]
MQIGRRIYHEISTGNVILDTGERQGSVVATTIDQDIASFTVLSERNRDTFDVIELPFGAYSQDFAECNGYRVNVDTKAIEFSYPDPSQPDAPQVFQKALTEQVAELKAQTQQMNDDLLALSDFVTNGGV